MVNTITSNVAAYGAQNNIGAASARASASIARLSSGNAINLASDDVAGLATGTSLRTQVTSLRTALANTTQGSSLLQVADGSLSQIVDILQRQKAIAVQAGSGSLTDTNRQLLNQEFQALTNEVNRIATTTSFNGVSLLSGGLGINPTLVSTDAMAAAAIVAAPTRNNNVVSASSKAIEFRRISDGALSTNQFVDSSSNILADSGLLAVDSKASGIISNAAFSDVNYGPPGVGSATLTVTLNGIDYSGKVIGQSEFAAAAFYTLTKGETGIRIRMSPYLRDAGNASYSINNIINNLTSSIITRTSIITGVDFEGTVLDGMIGGITGNAAIRLASSGAVSISNFRYEGNSGSSNSSILSVDINGKTFIATNVADTILDNSFAGNAKLQFVATNEAEVLSLDFTGLANPINNIRTSLTDRQAFIDALNIGFSRAGGGLNFGVGAGRSDTINVKYGSATTVNIYSGQSLDVSSAATAATASTVLDGAINQVISLRASVGALQSRFNFAGQSIQSSIESQDRARGALLDTDVAKESTRFAAAQVQLQAGVAVLAQANLLPSNLLNLLEGGLLGG
jgi:flagellin